MMKLPSVGPRTVCVRRNKDDDEVTPLSRSLPRLTTYGELAFLLANFHQQKNELHNKKPVHLDGYGHPSEGMELHATWGVPRVGMEVNNFACIHLGPAVLNGSITCIFLSIFGGGYQITAKNMLIDDGCCAVPA